MVRRRSISSGWGTEACLINFSTIWKNDFLLMYRSDRTKGDDHENHTPSSLEKKRDNDHRRS